MSTQFPLSLQLFVLFLFFCIFYSLANYAMTAL